MKFLWLFLAASALGGIVIAQTVERDKPAVVAAVAPVYPPIADAARVSGEVTVEVEIDREGRVTDANHTGGFKLLSKAAESAARRWLFAPSPGGDKKRTAQLVFSFRLVSDDTSPLDVTPIYYPPYKVETRKKPARIVQTRSY